MSAFKKIKARTVFIDMSEIHVPSWQTREITKAALAKTRALKKIDPFARCIGSKRIFETPDDLRKACDSYFKAQEYIINNKYGEPLINPQTGEYLIGTRPLTISGLARHIGVHTDTLRRYRAVAESGTIPYEFAQIIIEALQRIEEYAEARNYDRDGQRGGQFILQTAFRWETKKEQRESSKLKAETELLKQKKSFDKEKHDLEMKILEHSVTSLEDGGDSDINITITRASKED